MKYIVLEMQTHADGQVGTLLTAYDDKATAESAYYMVLAAAVLSSLAMHAAVLMMNDGTVLMKASYEHTQVPTPTPTQS